MIVIVKLQGRYIFWRFLYFTLNQASVLQGGDVSHLNKSSISAVRAQQTSGASSPALKLLQVLLPLLVILAAIFVPKYLL